MNLIMANLIFAVVCRLIRGEILVSQNTSSEGHISCRLLLNTIVISWNASFTYNNLHSLGSIEELGVIELTGLIHIA